MSAVLFSLELMSKWAVCVECSVYYHERMRRTFVVYTGVHDEQGMCAPEITKLFLPCSCGMAGGVMLGRPLGSC